MYLPTKDTLYKRSEKNLFDDDYAIFSDFLYKGRCCGYSFELHRQVDAIQMSIHNISLYKEVNKRYTFLLCWGLTTRQPLWVILCRLPEKGRKEIEEIVEEMKERNREERGTGMKGKKQKK